MPWERYYCTCVISLLCLPWIVNSVFEILNYTQCEKKKEGACQWYLLRTWLKNAQHVFFTEWTNWTSFVSKAWLSISWLHAKNHMLVFNGSWKFTKKPREWKETNKAGYTAEATENYEAMEIASEKDSWSIFRCEGGGLAWRNLFFHHFFQLLIKTRPIA